MIFTKPIWGISLLVTILVAIVVLVPGFKRPNVSVGAVSTVRSLEEPQNVMAPIANEEQSAQLARLWVGLLSKSSEQQMEAIKMIRDNNGLAMYPINARLKWMDDGCLKPISAAKDLDFFEMGGESLWKQVIPALASQSFQFAGWEKDVSARTLWALYECATNMHRFSMSLDLMKVPQGMTLASPEMGRLGLQFGICGKTVIIRDAILRSAEQSRFSGFDTETLLKRRRELQEERNKDAELFRSLQKETARWINEVKNLSQ